jgi:dihydroneopterin aldolase
VIFSTGKMTPQPALLRLTIKNLEYYAYHGVLPEERRLGGKYALDVELRYDAWQAATNDDVRSAVNYQDVVETVGRVFHAAPRNLIETLACQIAHALLGEFSALHEVTITLRKYAVPLGQAVEYVEVAYTALHSAQ